MTRTQTVRALLLAGALASVATAALDAKTVRRKWCPAPHATAARAPVTGVITPTSELVLSSGRGRVINLSTDAAFVWTSNPTVASVVVSPDSPRQIQLMAGAPGEATVYAKSRSGAILYSVAVRVGLNANTVDQMLRMAMPEAKIVTTQMNGLILLTGTVGAPDDVAEAERLVKAYIGDKVEVVARLRTATPLQVNLRVKIAEVSRSLAKSINSNLLTRDANNGFNIAQGRNFTGIGPVNTSNLQTLDASARFGFPAGTLRLPYDPVKQDFVYPGTGTVADFKTLATGTATTSLGVLGRLFGIDIAAAFDLAETDGLVTLLAEPNLTALSGETASFLAGGEFPIPISQDLGKVSIEYKQYGVSLAFTPTVLADGRISMRVRPEVSQLSSQGAVTLNGYTVPGLTTRRTETTVELGSGQSFMIGGLLQNNNSNSIQKAPGLGDVPVLGSLFRSNGYQRNQTELMIIVTPYLVKPVDANEIALPTDGLRTPTDLQTFLLGQTSSGRTGEGRPKPSLAPPVTVPAPSVGAALVPAPIARPNRSRSAAAPAAPGFSN